MFLLSTSHIPSFSIGHFGKLKNISESHTLLRLPLDSPLQFCLLVKIQDTFLLQRKLNMGRFMGKYFKIILILNLKTIWQ